MLAPAQNTRSLPDVRIDRADFGMLEAQPLDRVVELDVDAEVVRVQLELVARTKTAVLLDVHRERRDTQARLWRDAVDRELPVLVARRLGSEVDRWLSVVVSAMSRPIRG